MSFIMQIGQGIASAIQGYYASRRQSQMFEAQAAQAEQESTADAEMLAARGRRLQASAIARAGAGGVGESPSTLDVLVDNAQAIARDISTTEYRGAMAAWGLREGARMSRWAGRTGFYTLSAQAVGAAAQGYEKYGYQRDTSQRAWEQQNQRDNQAWLAQGTRETWFSNSSEYDGSLSTDYGGNAATGARGDL